MPGEELPDAAAPYGVTICSGGIDDWVAFQKELRTRGLDASDWDVVDLTKILKKNPDTTVGWHQDCTHDWTYQVVSGQDQFGEINMAIIESVAKGYRKQFLHCKSGWHRASTVGKSTESNLNSLMYTDDTRCFNAQWFGLHKCDNQRMWSSQIDRALGWSESTWLSMDGPTNATEIFGHRAAQGDPKSWANFVELQEMIDNVFCRAWHTPLRDKRVAAPQKAKMKPRQPPTPPPAHKRCPDMPPPPPQPVRKRAREEHIDSDSDDKLPDWASFEPNVENWWQLFDKLNVDESARMSLFVLAQHSEQGFKEANQITLKLIKKVNESTHISNASAFVFSSVINAYHAMGETPPSSSSSSRGRRHG